MPSFDTPEPISVTAHVGAGTIQFTAGDRTETVVEIKPQDPKRDKDVRAAEQTEVTYGSGVLTVRTKERRFIGPSGAVDVTVELPTGSNAEITGSVTQVYGDGRLGEVRVKASVGDVRLDTTGPLQLTVAHGSITVERVEGAAEITTSYGGIRVGDIGGPAVLKNSHGTTTVGAVTGDLRVSGAHGAIDIARAEGSVTATNAYGGLHIAEAVRGTVQLETNYGAIEVGIRQGTAAWLDVSSDKGQVRNTLTASEGPEESEDTIKIHARTKHGNVELHRSRA